LLTLALAVNLTTLTILLVYLLPRAGTNQKWGLRLQALTKRLIGKIPLMALAILKVGAFKVIQVARLALVK
tara:strand:- start:379 stop:591 length:213 start_codon:yes stop_codon:yes gene_type:complete